MNTLTPSSHSTQFQPRLPKPTERDELWHYLCAEQQFEMPLDGSDDTHDAATIRGHIDNAAIAVFDHYTTDSVGYAGKVMCVIWPGGPELHEVFTWVDECLTRVSQTP